MGELEAALLRVFDLWLNRRISGQFPPFLAGAVVEAPHVFVFPPHVRHHSHLLHLQFGFARLGRLESVVFHLHSFLILVRLNGIDQYSVNWARLQSPSDL